MRPGELRLAAVTWLGYHPTLYRVFRLFRPKQGAVMVNKSTEIVIEGYPRSGNTFAVAAFTLAQGRRVRVAHHLHAPAQIMLAARWRIPAVVLVRRPEDAVVSRVIRNRSLSVSRALAEYVGFYRAVLPLRDHFVLAPFEQVVSDFGSVIAEVNRKFGTHFVPFTHTEDNVARVFGVVEELGRLEGGGLGVDELRVARPSPVRERIKECERGSLTEAASARILEVAREVYGELVGGGRRLAGEREAERGADVVTRSR